VENYNNYLYDIELSANETMIEVPEANASPMEGLQPGSGSDLSGMDLFSMFRAPAKSKGMDMDFDAVVSPIVVVELPAEDESEDIEFIEEERAKTLEIEKFNQLKSEFYTASSNLDDLNYDINEIREVVANEMDARQIQGMVMDEIEKLKLHPRLKPDQIKKMSGEYLSKVFNVQSVDEIDLGYVLDRSNMKKLLSDNLSDLKRKEIDYRIQMEKVDNLITELKTFNLVGDQEFRSFENEIVGKFSESQGQQQMLENDIQSLTDFIPQVQKDDIGFLAALRYEYEAISANDFSRTYRTPAQGDITTFNINFKLKDTTLAGETERLIETAPIEVPVFGGFKVNASLGISFGQYKDQPQNYFVRDTVILAEDQDNFIPILTSFIHFYGQGSRAISLGGTIGVGLPIVNVGNNQSISFFAGPSVIIGKGDRIVLSVGVMDDRVARLGQGLEIGESYFSDGDVVPTIQRYELGYFVGVSYNLLGEK